MNNALHFLVETLIGLYLMVVILRLWLQAVQADYYNPLSQFVVKATNPLVKPLRTILPVLGRLDLAALVVALLVAALKVAAILMINYGGISIPAILLNAPIVLLAAFLSLLFWVLIIRAILSWFSQGYNPMEMLLAQLTEPLLAPIRRIIPTAGGLDFSVLILIIIVQFLRILITG
ncbi:YggT family protein [Idiomarina xiamenensis]|uniref:Integral membrane protein n=1 Tax=Idiomarina xiamenensis 10-D-4 TaxID=740709 RepID=K2L1P3_9GAMM|nr:YggT family protein [Idiomarina xiamenensis]EKE83725.1 hypothetical protein A10D4_07750 [Idiomarina xiamenensis 10-D-4]